MKTVYEMAIGKLNRNNLTSDLALFVEFYNTDGEKIDGVGDKFEIMLVHMACAGWDFKGEIQIERERLFIWQREVSAK